VALVLMAITLVGESERVQVPAMMRALAPTHR
jgi:hypothetical protein